MIVDDAELLGDIVVDLNLIPVDAENILVGCLNRVVHGSKDVIPSRGTTTENDVVSCIENEIFGELLWFSNFKTKQRKRWSDFRTYCSIKIAGSAVRLYHFPNKHIKKIVPAVVTGRNKNEAIAKFQKLNLILINGYQLRIKDQD